MFYTAWKLHLSAADCVALRPDSHHGGPSLGDTRLPCTHATSKPRLHHCVCLPRSMKIGWRVSNYDRRRTANFSHGVLRTFAKVTQFLELFHRKLSTKSINSWEWLGKNKNNIISINFRNECDLWWIAGKLKTSHKAGHTRDPSAKSDAAKAREEARKRLLAAKAAGRQRKASENDADEVQIFIS